MTSLNPEQLAAIDESGVVFVSAGAGTGKTSVLVERFVKAVTERGLPLDGILVITYTERAAGELRVRIRERLAEAGREELARDVDRAWISTIHGFCFRLLRQYAVEAGLDPRFRVLDEAQAGIIRTEAFDHALELFCAEHEPTRIQLLTTYGAQLLRSMIVGAFERLRSAGLELALGDRDESRLTEAIDALRAEIAELSQGLSEEAGAQSRGREVLEVLDHHDTADALLDLSDLRLDASEHERSTAYNDALSWVERAAFAEVAARDRTMLGELLGVFAERYEAAKAAESGVDFEDLQLIARDLLRSNTRIRDEVSWQLRSIMVDEFQDTNRLQCELVDLIGAEELFFVGDEFQSIYRFRHADVDVFRERRASSAGVLALTHNYRARPEVLSVVNQIFQSEFGEEFEPLSAAGRFPDSAFSPAVELLVTDKASYNGKDVHWRVAEARHVASRVRELIESGETTAGEVVLLFSAGTDAERYELALREEGLSTYRAAGQGYFESQQVADLIAYLRLLLNRYDDRALVSVLASPLVGCSNDALYLLRRAAGRRPLFSGLERDLPEGLGQRDRRLFEAFRQRYERLVRFVGQMSLESLCERVLTEHDYDLAVLARWDGSRRYANLRKLARLARSYEAIRRPDLAGFLDFIADLEASGTRELEAAAVEEGAQAVRLLTVHAAKGLEFKTVVLADAGRGSPSAAMSEFLCLPDGQFGFRVVDPATGERRPDAGYEQALEAERKADEAESRRVLYVAMTRAMDRLIISGALDPERKAGRASSIGWLFDRLDLDLGEDGPTELERDGARLLLRVDRWQESSDEAVAREDGSQLELFAPGDEGSGPSAPELAELPGVAEPPRVEVRRLSYSALALFDRCSYRYYAERVLGLSPRPRLAPIDAEPGLAATELGDVVHVILEEDTPESDVEARARALYPAATADDLERVVVLVGAWRESSLARRLGASEATRPELAFTYEHDGVLLHGRFDAFLVDDGSALVVDYKTNRLDDLEPADLVDDDYSLQRLVYALAALRSGVDSVEIAYVFLERPDNPVTATFTAADVSELESELSHAIEAIQSADFRPTPSEYACAECPALDVVCAGPRLLATAEAEVASAGVS